MSKIYQVMNLIKYKKFTCEEKLEIAEKILDEVSAERRKERNDHVDKSIVSIPRRQPRQ